MVYPHIFKNVIEADNLNYCASYTERYALPYLAMWLIFC